MGFIVIGKNLLVKNELLTTKLIKKYPDYSHIK